IGLAGLGSVLAFRAKIIETFADSPLAKFGTSLGRFEPEAACRDLVAALAQGAVAAILTAVIVLEAGRRPRLAGLCLLVVTTADLAFANAPMFLWVPQAMLGTPSELMKIIQDAERAKPPPGGMYRV